MSDNVECDSCFNPFPRYATICPACKQLRWKLWFHFIPPDPKTGEYRDENDRGIEADDLTVITYSEALHPKIKKLFESKRNAAPLEELCFLLRGYPQKLDKPLGDVIVKQVGFFWVNESDWDAVIPAAEFPPARRRADSSAADRKATVVRPNAERNQWAYEQYCGRPMDTVSKLRSEAKAKGWHFDSNQAFNKAVESHCKANGIQMPKRKTSRIKRD